MSLRRELDAQAKKLRELALAVECIENRFQVKSVDVILVCKHGFLEEQIEIYYPLPAKFLRGGKQYHYVGTKTETKYTGYPIAAPVFKSDGCGTHGKLVVLDAKKK